MVTAFLKSQNEERAICLVSKFVDRIQIPLKGTDVEVLRHFCISVDPISPVPIHELFILVPQKRERINNLENRSDELLNRQDPFNKLTTGYTVGNIQQRVLRDWDGIPTVRVLTAAQLEPENLGEEFTSIQIFFNEALNPGEHGALRFKYTIKNYLLKLSRYKREKIFQYFIRPTRGAPPGYSAQREVKCLPWFGNIRDPQARRVPGGFDVFIRYPVDIAVNSTPESSVLPTISKWNLDGTQSIDKRVIGWRLRHLVKNLSPGNPPELGLGNDIRVRNVFDKSYTIRDAWIMLIYSALIALGISIGVIFLVRFLGQ